MTEILQLIATGVTLEAAEGDTPRRTLAGQAVPYNTVARVASGQLVKFLPGSLPLDGVAPKVLRNHDRTQPLGVVVNRTADAAGINVRARISAIAAGDEVLTLAADGVLDSWSVGADPLEYTFEASDQGDVMVVAKAAWQELSVLPYGAFPTAKVTEVAAAPHQEETVVTTTAEAPPTTVVASNPTPPPTPDPVPQPAPQPVTPTPTVPAAPARPPLDLRGAATLIAATSRGEMSAQQLQSALALPQIQGALGNATLGTAVTGNAGLNFPAFIPEIKGLIEIGRPVIALINKRPLPANGLEIDYPQWTTLPTVAEQAAEKDPVHSGTSLIEIQRAPVHTFAGANDISLQLAQRSNPSFMEAYLAAMAEDYSRKTENFVTTNLLAAATAATAPTTPTFINSVAALFAAFPDPKAIPAGPFFLVVSWDVAISLIPTTELNGPAYWDIAFDFGSMVPTATTGPESDVNRPGGGLTMVVDRLLGPKTMLLGSRMGSTFYEDPAAPATIRVVDVSMLGFDVGVYGFSAHAVEYPLAFTKLVGTTLVSLHRDEAVSISPAEAPPEPVDAPVTAPAAAGKVAK